MLHAASALQESRVESYSLEVREVATRRPALSYAGQSYRSAPAPDHESEEPQPGQHQRVGFRLRHDGTETETATTPLGPSDPPYRCRLSWQTIRSRGRHSLYCPGRQIETKHLSLLNWKPLPPGPVPEADNSPRHSQTRIAAPEPLVVVASKIAKAENDTSVLAVTVKLEKEGALAFAIVSRGASRCGERGAGRGQ